MVSSNYNMKHPPKIGVVDQYAPKNELLMPFAVDDALLHASHQGSLPHEVILHFWPTDATVFLGGMDMRTPFIDEGLRYLVEDKQLIPVIRPAGGLAVVSNPGILNFTVILKAGNERLPIDAAYQWMVDVMNRVFAPYGHTATTGEVKTSYCPGAYDVSLNGRKIAGIAQRRIGRAVGIYVYISLFGNQQARGELIRAFYAHAIQGQETKTFYPDIAPESMINCGDIIPAFREMTTFKDALLQAIEATYQSQSQAIALETLDLAKPLNQMTKRNQPIHDLIQSLA